MDIIDKIKSVKKIWEIINDLSASEIEKVLSVAAEKYYDTYVSLITDEEYDSLKERLMEIKPNSKILKTIGTDNIHGKKVKLPYWMGSMDKIKTDEKELKRWLEKYPGPYQLTDKLDGISCLVVFKNDKMKLFTRGNGEYGKDVTHLLEYINFESKNINKLVSDKNKKEITLRGELIMSKSNFKKYSKKMANARNMVGGIVNSKKESINKKYAKDVDLIIYEMIRPKGLSPSEQLNSLKNVSIGIVNEDIFEDINFKILTNYLEKRKNKSKYEIDGIIVTNDDVNERNDEGNPDYAFAFKGLTETAIVTVTNIEWNPGKDGHLIPVVFYDPIKLSQVVMKQTTGFNANFIVKNNIGVGAKIKIIRSNEVIPYIVSVVNPSKKVLMPEEDYYWDKNKVNIILSNPDEDSRVIVKRLTKFVTNIGVENINDGIIKKLVDNGYTTIVDIIKLKVKDLLQIDGFQETLANKIIKNLKTQLSKLNVLKLMVASNCFKRGFGERKIKKILSVYPDICDEYLDKHYNKWYNKLIELNGFDDITVTSFLDNIGLFIKVYNKIKKIVNVKDYDAKVKKNGIFNGQKVVFTGFRMPSWKDMIEKEGGSVSGSVSKNTTLLVYKNGDESSAKFKNAVKLGIKTLSKSSFNKKYESVLKKK
jgi:NAD-dependent DNA ligase